VPLGQRVLHDAQAHAGIDDSLALVLCEIVELVRTVAAADVADDELEALVGELPCGDRIQPLGDVTPYAAVREGGDATVDHAY
jgi:hypothetical protein